MVVGQDALDPETKATTPRESKSAQATVVKNTLALIVGQVLAMPLTLAMYAVLARKIGPDQFGYIYLSATLVGFGFLPVEWGQPGALPQMIATDRAAAGPLLGAGITWRLGSSIVAYGALALLSDILHYGVTFQWVLLITTITRLSGTICGACLDAARGFENTALTAYSQVRWSLLCAGLVIGSLMLGGGLFAVLFALLAADAINTTFVWLGMRRYVPRLAFELRALRSLLSIGTPFMFLSLVLMLQPIIDAVCLSKLGSPEAMGWYAAARKLIGVLVFPVVAMVGGLYPTLCRLFVEDMAGFRKLSATALRTASILVLPVAIGTALYPQLGIRIFNEASFKPAEDDLRILAVFIFPVYFTMTLGAAITAAGRNRPWAISQFGCVAVSAIVDPFLIPFFERRSHNGGLGLCIASVLSEFLMIACGFFIAPRGLFDRQLLATIARALIAGAAMVAVSYLLSGLNPYVGAVTSALTYGGCLWIVGGADRETVQQLREIVARKAAGRLARG